MIAWLDSKTYYTAFQEGWALYAENPLISDDTDVYDNKPMKQYGMLKWQASEIKSPNHFLYAHCLLGTVVVDYSNLSFFNVQVLYLFSLDLAGVADDCGYRAPLQRNEEISSFRNVRRICVG